MRTRISATYFDGKQIMKISLSYGIEFIDVGRNPNNVNLPKISLASLSKLASLYQDAVGGIGGEEQLICVIMDCGTSLSFPPSVSYCGSYRAR